MKMRLASAALAANVLAATLILPTVIDANTALAEEKPAECYSLVAGTYLTQILNSDGSTASRGLVTLTKGGNIIISDSSQAGVAGAFNPFGIAQGNYKCTGARSIHATALDFSYPGSSGPGGIARLDYQATFKLKNQSIQGTISLSFFGLTDNPLAGQGPNPIESTFTGQLVTMN